MRSSSPGGRVGLFSSETAYDRTRILDAASKARARRRYRKAIALYRRVLAVEPANVELHARLAPLLAATGGRFDAWIHFRTCAEAAAAESRFDQAANIYREAARCLPQQLEAWERLAATERRRGQEKAAVTALLEGRRRFRGRRRRAEAIHLLRRARELDPGNVDIALDLARLLARNRQQSEALLLLDRLAEKCDGGDLRRVRAAQWRITPTLRNTWRWLRAGSAGSEGGRRIHA